MVSLPSGSKLGRYQVTDLLGHGGMASVFKASDPELNRFVAVKVLPSYHAEDPTFVERFRREAQAIAGLNHPNIIQVHDFGEDKGFIYIVMEYVTGGTLEDRLKDRYTLDDVLELISPLADALDYAHRQGIIHRDMKPANVLLDDGGKPILTDFGLARVLESSAGLTRTDAIVGTPEYMAPEQALGGSVDHRADLYSLGVIIYRMLLGDIPFPADTAKATLMAHIHQPVPLPSTLDPHVDPRLEEVLLKALAKDPDERYQTAGQLVGALGSVFAQPETGAKPREIAPVVPTPTTIMEDTSGIVADRERAVPSPEQAVERRAPSLTSRVKRSSRLTLAVGGVVLFGAALGGILFVAGVFGGNNDGRPPALALLPTITPGPQPPDSGSTQVPGPSPLSGTVPTPASSATSVASAPTTPIPGVDSPSIALTATPEPAPTLVPGSSTDDQQVLRLALGADPAPSGSFDYYRSPGPHLLQAISPAFNGLVEPSPQDPNLLVSALAERWGTAVGNRWVFDLRSDARFHNGKLVTAADVKATFDYILTSGSAMVREDLARMVRLSEIVDDHSFSITLDAPSASFFPVLSQGFMNIYPQELLLPTAPQNITNTIIGTGAFVLEQYEPGSLLKYVKNPDYFIADRPYLDGLSMLVIPDGASRIAALSAEQIDLSLPGLTAQEASSQQGAGFTVLQGPSLSGQTLGFNTLQPPWNNPSVRLAASLAIDRGLLRDRVLGGEGGLGYYMPPWGQWALPTNLSPTLYDPDQAMDLLAAAGLQGGFKTDLTMTAGENRELIAVLLLTMWAQIGIDIEVQIVNDTEALKRRSDGNYRPQLMGFSGLSMSPTLFSGTPTPQAPPETTPGSATLISITWSESRPRSWTMKNVGPPSTRCS